MEKNDDTQGKFKILPLEFTRKGSLFVQKSRKGDVCLYERRDDDGYKCWEVIMVQQQKGGLSRIGGVDIVFETKEKYPSDEQFGVNGWCFSLEQLADERYNAILCTS
jgi:hypothetical protein